MNRELRKDLIIVLLFAALVLSFSSQHEAKQALIEDTTAPKHDADFTICKMVQLPPIIPPGGRYELVPGQPPKDKGIS